MKETLKAIQILSQLGKILSQVSIILSFVGFGLCVGGIVLGNAVLKFNGITIHGLTDGNVNQTMYIALIVTCLGQAILSYFARHYFTRELKDKTPFDFEGAKEMFKLGILTICISLVTQIICAFLKQESLGLNYIHLGITFIILSILFKYGAYIKENQM